MWRLPFPPSNTITIQIHMLDIYFVSPFLSDLCFGDFLAFECRDEPALLDDILFDLSITSSLSLTELRHDKLAYSKITLRGLGLADLW